jgi:hypothetical protein
VENLTLGWHVLAQTSSVLVLTLFGLLQDIGTLVAPLIGIAGDRIGHRTVLCAMPPGPSRFRPRGWGWRSAACCTRRRRSP